MTLKTISIDKPIVHCMTNYVVANYTANGLLAAGASPIMADEALEVRDITAISTSLLINIGTINERTLHSMIIAGKQANALHKHVVLDPVGVGASDFRKEAIEQLLENVQFSAIRCNAGELAALCNIEQQSRGVDAGEVDFQIEVAAKQLAIRYKCVVAISGEEDTITDGVRVAKTTGGHAWMQQITGAGCLLSALCTAVLGKNKDVFAAISGALADYKLVAEQAFSQSRGIGDFQLNILTELQKFVAMEVV